VKSNMRPFGRRPSAVSTDKRLLLLTQRPTLDDTVSLARLACANHGLVAGVEALSLTGGSSA